MPQRTVPSPRAPAGKRRLRWAWLVLLAVAGCRNNAPSAFVIDGEWWISYSLTDTVACPVGPERYSTCGGSGVLQLTRDGQTLEGDYDVPGGCETCTDALDYLPTGVLADGRVADGVVEFTLHGCRFAADLPPSGSTRIEGTATGASPGNATLQGPWVMTRPTP
jgi:hypothetical protein